MQKSTKRALIIIPTVLVIIVAVMAVYLSMELSRISVAPAPPQHLGKPALGAYVSSQELLFYNNSQYIIPSLVLNYSSWNASSVYIFGALYKVPIPGNVYFLNATNECIGCGDIGLMLSYLSGDLYNYGLVANQSDLTGVSLQNVTGIRNNSILIIPNGLMPSAILQAYGNTTVISYLLSKGTSIIYVGRDFSNMLLPGSVVTPSGSLPGFLSSTQYSNSKTPFVIPPNTTFYFSSPTFSFLSGESYYNITYTNIGNGSIVAFPNYLNSWATPAEAASDISKAIASMFWLPYYSYDYSKLLPNSFSFSSGSFGMAMQTPPIDYSYPVLAALNSGHGRIILYTNGTFSPSSNSFFYYSDYGPDFHINGTLSLQGTVIPNIATDVQMQVFTNSTLPTQIEPHISIYELNGSEIYSLPLSPLSASGNFTFIKYLSFALGPGRYVASLQSLSNMRYASALMYVPPLVINPIRENFSSGSFAFLVSDGGIPVSETNYSISANRLYPGSGIVHNGTINYAFPKGAPQMYGNVSFSISMFSQNFTYTAYNPPKVIRVNSQYVELAVVVIIVFLMVVLVRPPNRDEFYIDVPLLPPQGRTQIKIQDKELVNAFDKLNMYYHWKYMPLSRKEIRNAISNYIRYGNVPVSLTYNNIDILLSKLLGKNLLIERDGLFMPSSWVDQSGHDPDYLATFKKLREFFVVNTFIFSDLDSSNLADMIATIRGDRVYIIIYSKSSKFRKIILYPDVKTYIAFLNSEKLEEFRARLYASTAKESEELRMYISSGMVKLVDSDSPADQIT